MAPERITITVKSSVGEDGPLTVQDALQQVLDFFDLLASAQGSGDGDAVSWNLVTISKSSPLSATGEAFSTDPSVIAEPVARRAKKLVAESIETITIRGEVPPWMDDFAQRKIRSLFDRTLNGVGRMDIQFDEHSPLLVIVEKSARSGLNTLHLSEAQRLVASEDLSRSEMGSIEGVITETTTYHHQPAIKVSERLTGESVTCIIAKDLAETIGHTRDWHEVWSGRRVLVAGEVRYRSDGKISRVIAQDIRNIEPPTIELKDIVDPNFTGGRKPKEYLEELWEDEDG